MKWIDEWLGGKCNETDYNELQSIFWCFNSFLANSGQSSICCTVGHRARDSQRKALQKEEAVASTGNWSRARLKVLDFCWVQEFPRTPVILISIWYFPGNCCQQELFKMISWINWILWWQKNWRGKSTVMRKVSEKLLSGGKLVTGCDRFKSFGADSVRR